MSQYIPPHRRALDLNEASPIEAAHDAYQRAMAFERQMQTDFFTAHTNYRAAVLAAERARVAWLEITAFEPVREEVR